MMKYDGSILSHYISKIRSPIRPLQLPFHAEIVAEAYAATSSPDPSPEKHSSCRPVEKYFHISAEVDGSSSDTDSEEGWIEASNDVEMSS